MLIASCALKGRPRAARNDRNEKLLCEVVRSLKNRDLPADAIVFSGGFFVQRNLSNRYLSMTFEERRDQLVESMGSGVDAAAQRLNALKSGALLIFGVDTGGPKSVRGDQLCVAWSAKGPVGVGRKVFPTEYEGKKGYVVSVDDFGASERIVEICGRSVLLCACYDGYGIASGEDKSKYILRMHDGKRRFRRGVPMSKNPEFNTVLENGLQRWDKLVSRVDAAAVVIHRFGQNGNGGFSTNYWRRHGIATASAALSGGWVVAGANFQGRLPNQKVDILASDGVPRDFLELPPSFRTTRDSRPICDYMGSTKIRGVKRPNDPVSDLRCPSRTAVGARGLRIAHAN